MAINKKDYENIQPCLYIHKQKMNVFLFRKVLRGRYFTKILTLENRSGWSKREYKAQALVEFVKWCENIQKVVKGIRLKDDIKVGDLYEMWKSKKDTNKQSTINDVAFYESYLKREIHMDLAVDVIADRIDKIIHKLMYEGVKNKSTGLVKLLSKRTAYDNTRRILGEIFDIALRNQLININPCDLLTKIAQTTRKKIIKNARTKFLQVKSAILEIWADDPFYRAFFLMCLYGRRKSEVIQLRWQDVDMQNDFYYLIDTKNGNDYQKPLPRLVKEALSQIPADKNGLVFASPRTGKMLQNIDRQKDKIDEVVGFDDFKLHTTRHISGSALEELGASDAVIKDHLTHKRSGVTYDNYVTYNTYKNSCIALEMLENLKDARDEI